MALNNFLHNNWPMQAFYFWPVQFSFASDLNNKMYHNKSCALKGLGTDNMFIFSIFGAGRNSIPEVAHLVNAVCHHSSRQIPSQWHLPISFPSFAFKYDVYCCVCSVEKVKHKKNKKPFKVQTFLRHMVCTSNIVVMLEFA